MIRRPVAKFTLQEAQHAADIWGANCGPGAIAAVMDTTLEAIRPHLDEFEKKRYTNTTLMYAILRNLKVSWAQTDQRWPTNGLVRVQWEGPWTDPGQPWQARQRHTHWVASRVVADRTFVFDINCICAGGWVPESEWRNMVVPWLLKQVEPLAYGTWHATHKIEVKQ